MNKILQIKREWRTGEDEGRSGTEEAEERSGFVATEACHGFWLIDSFAAMMKIYEMKVSLFSLLLVKEEERMNEWMELGSDQSEMREWILIFGEKVISYLDWYRWRQIEVWEWRIELSDFTIMPFPLPWVLFLFFFPYRNAWVYWKKLFLIAYSSLFLPSYHSAMTAYLLLFSFCFLYYGNGLFISLIFIFFYIKSEHILSFYVMFWLVLLFTSEWWGWII